MKNLAGQGHSLTAAAEKFARDIKEKLCHVARVYDTELRALRRTHHHCR